MHRVPDIDELKALGRTSPYISDKTKLNMVLNDLEEIKKDLKELKQLINKDKR